MANREGRSGSPVAWAANAAAGIAGIALMALLSGCANDANGESSGLTLGFGGNAAAATAAPPGTPQDFVQNVGDRVLFETDSTDLTTVAKATLDAQAVWLSRYTSLRFTIEGHADERGTREYNIALGARRAQNVRDYLMAHGVSPTRIQTISYGKERPVAVCNDATCWNQNRRAVTVLASAGS
jgi:peptidoglycan-associated lipoprotein